MVKLKYKEIPLEAMKEMSNTTGLQSDRTSSAYSCGDDDSFFASHAEIQIIRPVLVLSCSCS